jgi:uncharacterized protein DUF4136
VRVALRLSSLPLALVLVFFAACASKPTIRSNVDPAANFAGYRTFGFLNDGKSSYDSMTSRYLKDAVTREMQARGLQPADSPDLLVNIHVQSKDKVSVNQVPTGYTMGYYGYRAGAYGWGAGVSTTVENYTEGTLNVDVVDRAANKLVWEGIAVGRISNKARDNPQAAIDAVVKQVFERYPAKTAVTAEPQA